MTESDLDTLIASAYRAKDNAYSIIHNFPTGAAVLTTNGSFYQGCNVESVISGMGICAERNAINHAVANGMYEFEAIAVTSNLDEPIKPCGMCLQYIGEFSHISNIDIEIVMVGANGQINQSRISDMLPESFGPKSLGIDLSQYRNKSDQQNTI